MSYLTGQVLTQADLAGFLPWTAYTPTWTNLTIGNGTVLSAYTQFGKTVFYRVRLTWGSTTSASGAWRPSMPVSVLQAYASPIGGFMVDISTSAQQSCVFIPETSILAATAGTVTATAPWTWATGDIIVINGSYEAA